VRLQTLELRLDAHAVLRLPESPQAFDPDLALMPGLMLGGGVLLLFSVVGFLLSSSRYEEREHFCENELIEIALETVWTHESHGVERTANKGPQNPR
jgi:hypothetical protein